MLKRKEKIMFMLLKMVILAKRENLSKKFQRLQSFKVSKLQKLSKTFQKVSKSRQKCENNHWYLTKNNVIN